MFKEVINDCLKFKVDERPTINQVLRSQMFNLISKNTSLFKKRISMSQTPNPILVNSNPIIQPIKKINKVETQVVKKFVSPSPINSNLFIKIKLRETKQIN